MDLRDSRWLRCRRPRFGLGELDVAPLVPVAFDPDLGSCRDELRPLLALYAVSGWLLAGELLGRDRGAQLLAGAVCGLAPMATFISAAVTPHRE